MAAAVDMKTEAAKAIRSSTVVAGGLKGMIRRTRYTLGLRAFLVT